MPKHVVSSENKTFN